MGQTDGRADTTKLIAFFAILRTRLKVAQNRDKRGEFEQRERERGRKKNRK